MTSCDKILGIHVDHNLNWHNHFKFLSKKISSYRHVKSNGSPVSLTEK